MHARVHESNQKSASSSTPVQTGILQRKCTHGKFILGGSPCEESAKKHSGIQQKYAIGASNDALGQKADRTTEQAMASSSHSDIQARPLAAALQRDTGPAFGHNFSRVSVYSGAAPYDKVTLVKPVEPNPIRISQPNDPAEIEADQIASSLGQGFHSGNRTPTSSIQAKRSSGVVDEQVPSNVASRINSALGGGSPLNPAARKFFELRLGANLSNVRIHTGDRASGLSRELRAKAFTLGSDVFFGNDFYSPETESGRRLLAHELTHVAQFADVGGLTGAGKQRAGTTIHRSIDTSRPPSSDPIPPLSKSADGYLDKIRALSTRVYEKNLPYTDATQRAVEGFAKALTFKILHLDGVQVFRRNHNFVGRGNPGNLPVYTYHYQQGAHPLTKPGRLFAVIDTYITAVNEELDRDPKEDTYQEGNILGLWRRFERDYQNAYELEESIERLREQIQNSDQEPGDFPLPPDENSQMA